MRLPAASKVSVEHETYKEMLTAHALYALDREEAQALEAHLATCVECRAELDQWRETAAALAYAAPLAEPSAGLRARLLQDARTHAQTGQTEKDKDKDDAGLRVKREAALSSPETLPASQEATPGETPQETPSSTSAASLSGKVLPFVPPVKRRWSAPAIFGALAASLVFAALLVSLYVLWQRNTRMQGELASLSERLRQSQGELARERDERAPLAAPESQAAMLAGTQAAPRAHAMLAFDRRTGRAMLLAYDLPPAPAGKAYQLWFIADGHVMPGAVFTPDARGHAQLRDQMPAEGLKAPSAIFAVTLEPASGVSTPTGDKYLLSQSS